MKHLNIFACTLAVLTALSCTKSVSGVTGGEGTVGFSVSGNIDVTDITRSSVSDYTALPSSGDFKIVVRNADNTEIYSGAVSDWDESTKLPSGNYSVTASYGSEGEEGFDKPYFTGNTAFVVNGGGKTEVSIPAALGNSIIKFSFSDSFRNYFPSYSFTVKTGGGTVIEFPASETRAAFVEAYKFTVDGTLTTQAGVSKTFSKSFEVNAKTCYTISFNASDIGGVTVTVTFNDTTETVTLDDIELNE